uniref:C2H2-type domain-containing protein n=1 Tax=Junco hyemalis TaxID=40217 RepID=A0A8C5JYI6_JUNHY
MFLPLFVLLPPSPCLIAHFSNFSFSFFHPLSLPSLCSFLSFFLPSFPRQLAVDGDGRGQIPTAEPCGRGRFEQLHGSGIQQGGKPWRSHMRRGCMQTQPRSSEEERPSLYWEGGQSFGQSSELGLQQRLHDREKPYKCLDCGKSFSWSSHLIHPSMLRTSLHTVEWPFKYPDCGKSFVHSPTWSSTGTSTLTSHQASGGTHQGEALRLITHQHLHMGEKPCKCLECGKSFSWSSSLITHQRPSTWEQPYSCGKCRKGFSWSSCLICYQRIHTGEPPSVGNVGRVSLMSPALSPSSACTLGNGPTSVRNVGKDESLTRKSHRYVSPNLHPTNPNPNPTHPRYEDSLSKPYFLHPIPPLPNPIPLFQTPSHFSQSTSHSTPNPIPTLPIHIPPLPIPSHPSWGY